MEKKRFSSEQLYALRNEIPVATLIEKGLDILCHARHGRFCFQCPVCNGFNTAVKRKTNLAECFGCEKKFNTIDLVMAIRQLDFVDSVRFLEKFYENMAGIINRGPAAECSGNDLTQCVLPKKTPSDSPEHIGQILGDVIMSQRIGSTEHQKVLPPPPTAANQENHQLSNERILELEQQVQYLSYQIEKIFELIDQKIPSN